MCLGCYEPSDDFGARSENKRLQGERKRREKGAIITSGRRAGTIHQLLGLIRCVLSLQRHRVPQTAGDGPWQCCYHKGHPAVCRMLRTTADPMSVLDVTVSTGVGFSPLLETRRGTNRTPPPGQGSASCSSGRSPHQAGAHPGPEHFHWEGFPGWSSTGWMWQTLSSSQRTAHSPASANDPTACAAI